MWFVARTNGNSLFRYPSTNEGKEFTSKNFSRKDYSFSFVDAFGPITVIDKTIKFYKVCILWACAYKGRKRVISCSKVALLECPSHKLHVSETWVKKPARRVCSSCRLVNVVNKIVCGMMYIWELWRSTFISPTKIILSESSPTGRLDQCTKKVWSKNYYWSSEDDINSTNRN